jgi:pimeloyl-ACP methyl ester carboxylesterase
MVIGAAFDPIEVTPIQFISGSRTIQGWGKHDLSFDLSEPERYRKDVPNAEVHVLDAGHFALDTAADEIAEFVRGFVASSRSEFLARQAG